MPRKTRRKPRVDRRRRSRVKKSGKRRRIAMYGGMTEEEIVSLLQKEMMSLFPEIDPSHIHIRTILDNTTAEITIKNCKETDLHYLEYYPSVVIEFSKKLMQIDLLTGCSPISGREILFRFISLARHLGLFFVILDDASEIYMHPSVYGRKECLLSLAHLRILLKGESWYQSLGFMSDENAIDREHNERVRNMPFRDFIMEIVDRENDPLANAESFLEALLNTFPELDANMRVSDAIQEMVKTVNAIGESVCESHEFILLKRLVDGCALNGKDDKPLLYYENAGRLLSLN